MVTLILLAILAMPVAVLQQDDPPVWQNPNEYRVTPNGESLTVQRRLADGTWRFYAQTDVLQFRFSPDDAIEESTVRTTLLESVQ